MIVRSLLAAGCVAAAAAVVAPAAKATGPVGYDPCCVPVVVDPCCEPPELTHRQRKAERRIARLERRQDRIRDRAFPEYGYGAPAGYGAGYDYAAPSYGYSSSYSSYGYNSYGYGY